MITDNNKKLAQWAMDYALKKRVSGSKVGAVLQLQRFI